MSYKVKWQPEALNNLTNLWLSAATDDRREITKAVRQIELALQNDPFGASESRPNGRRIFFGPPLGVLFQVDPRLALVRILRAWRF